jgi:hypothetical protein
MRTKENLVSWLRLESDTVWYSFKIRVFWDARHLIWQTGTNSSTLKMETEAPSPELVSINQMTQDHAPEYCSLEDLKPHIINQANHTTYI